jgi:hypothetical protein
LPGPYGGTSGWQCRAGRGRRFFAFVGHATISFIRAGLLCITAAMKGAQGFDGHRAGPCANHAAGQLASEGTAPARQGDQIAAALMGISPAAPASGAE